MEFPCGALRRPHVAALSIAQTLEEPRVNTTPLGDRGLRPPHVGGEIGSEGEKV